MKASGLLVTGVTGSFGRAFVKRLLTEHNIPRICCLSRGEHAQATLREELGNDERLRWFIGDVRDRERLRRAFERVEIVVHAAALKRIEVGFYNPTEMVKTNILGAMNVIEAAIDVGVKRIVYLSSDKACEPISAYGQSKAMAETLFFHANDWTDHERIRFAVTRYGNVAGSQGSVIPIWRALKARGLLHVPVTDPDATRFWMTLREAVDLVIDTIDKMPGEIVVPTLPAYRLGDLCEAMGLSPAVVGMSPFEKKHEVMRKGQSSELAPRMSIQQLRKALSHV